MPAVTPVVCLPAEAFDRIQECCFSPGLFCDGCVFSPPHASIHNLSPTPFLYSAQGAAAASTRERRAWLF